MPAVQQQICRIEHLCRIRHNYGNFLVLLIPGDETRIGMIRRPEGDARTAADGDGGPLAQRHRQTDQCDQHHGKQCHAAAKIIQTKRQCIDLPERAERNRVVIRHGG